MPPTSMAMLISLVVSLMIVIAAIDECSGEKGWMKLLLFASAWIFLYCFISGILLTGVCLWK